MMVIPFNSIGTTASSRDLLTNLNDKLQDVVDCPDQGDGSGVLLNP